MDWMELEARKGEMGFEAKGTRTRIYDDVLRVKFAGSRAGRPSLLVPRFVQLSFQRSICFRQFHFLSLFTFRSLPTAS